MAEDKYNMKNPGVKRILQEVKEMQSNPSDDFVSLPLEVMRICVILIVFAPFQSLELQSVAQIMMDYGFKGDWCLTTDSSALMENIFEWQFAIRGPCDTEFEGVRTALVALIAFMPTNPNGALGSLDYKKEERRTLAIKSREAAPRFGTSERQKVIDEIHEYMLSKAPPVPELNPSQPCEEHSTDEANQSPQDAGEGSTNPAVGDRIVEEPNEGPLNVNPRPEGPAVPRQVPVGPPIGEHQLLRPRVQKPADDRLFTLAAVGLTVAIIVLLFKKFMKASGHGAFFIDES
ncbi:hypothetical protein RHMOL_Rhmol02G0004200 [Rhododendron molle]|uniref:Uncharacterized protein n=1 Tax=Rhododendron molle TaxID=49168 RepID=A0ACC0PK08_RHOML|nr:hypothetical protein RHMOL_Rhmol02G0004200 [Rhododendron molle]